MRLEADTARLETCAVDFHNSQCPDPYSGQYTTSLPAGTGSLDLAAWCTASVCPYGFGPLYEFAAVIYSSEVTVQEDIAPSVSGPSLTGDASGWVTSATSLSYAGSDQLGLRTLAVVEGGAEVASVAGHCVDWSVLPCSEPSVGASVGLGGTMPVAALRQLGEGVHTLRAVATDGAGNVSTSAPITVGVDATAPLAQNLGGFGSSRELHRALTWTLPEGGSPIVGARVRVCDGAIPNEITCSWNEAPPAGPYSFDLPASGSTINARVELRDAAGNSRITDPVQFNRDTVVPEAPTLSLVNVEGATRGVKVVTHDPTDHTIHTRLCQGSTCADLPTQNISLVGIVNLTLPAAGLYRVEVLLEDEAGNLGPPSTVTFQYAPGPGPGQPPGGGNASVALTATFPRKLRSSSILIRGTVAAKSTAKITVTLAGRNTKRKLVTVRKAVAPGATGTYAIRLKLPRHLKRKTGVLITVAATPNTGFAAAVQRKRIRG